VLYYSHHQEHNFTYTKGICQTKDVRRRCTYKMDNSVAIISFLNLSSK
jgi:hypothetical protein